MINRSILACCVALVVACGGHDESASTNTTGTPETETTGTAQSVQQTSSATATTTGITGGTSSTAQPADKEFVVNAGMAGLAEVQMGNLALKNARSADVKAFAQRMVSDHSRSNAELSQLVTAKGLALPAELAGKHQQALEHLQTLSGAEFDKAYMQHMVTDHQEAVTLFQTGTTAADADIQAYASKTLPILQQHLELATTVAGKI